MTDKIENNSTRIIKTAAGGAAGATAGGLIGSKIGIAAMGTAIAGTVPLAILGGIISVGAIILNKKLKSKSNNN